MRPANCWDLRCRIRSQKSTSVSRGGRCVGLSRRVFATGGVARFRDDGCVRATNARSMSRLPAGNGPPISTQSSASKGFASKRLGGGVPAPDTAPCKSKAAGLYMICTMSKHEVEKEGYDDALMLDWRGNIAESTGANIFMVQDGVIHTPTPDCFWMASRGAPSLTSPRSAATRSSNAHWSGRVGQDVRGIPDRHGRGSDAGRIDRRSDLHGRRITQTLDVGLRQHRSPSAAGCGDRCRISDRRLRNAAGPSGPAVFMSAVLRLGVVPSAPWPRRPNRAHPPTCAVSGLFQFPERRLGFEPIDQERARVQRGLPMGACRRDQHDPVARLKRP